MKLSFRRITSSISFIPEIDGLRFIAVVSVVLFHLNGFLVEKDAHKYADNHNYSLLNHILSHGHLGVPLFFVISGLILGIPFAKWHIDGESPVNLRKYFLRRLTRLEPPYILVMTLLLLGSVYVTQRLSLQEGMMSYFASIIYSHNFLYPGIAPLLNAPAWSLEIEVQFYMLAPVMASLFLIKSVPIRRLLVMALSILFLLINRFNDLPFISLINYVHYFLIGFLLSDLYISKSALLPKTKVDTWIALCLFVFIWLFDDADFITGYGKFTWEAVQLCSIFLFYYYVLFHRVFRVLSLRVFTDIGGMCYSIYLLHYPLISMFGNRLLGYSFSDYSFINVPVYSIILMCLILSGSSVFFLLIERPCMDKNWYKKIFSRRPVKS